MIGQTISHYKITAKLGEGGMGVVYRAEDLKLGRAVALKFLPSHLLESLEHKARFLHEARAAAALDHANICTVYEIDEADGQAFLAMACLEGQTLKQKIAERPLRLNEALDIAIQIGQGVQAAHEKGIVHRDIKPANVMITPQGQVKIMDFGLAQLSDRTKLTATGTKLGTPAYMSPEQTEGKPADRRSDIWSLGVVLYEMVAGDAPFGGENEAALAYGIVHTQPEPLTALRTGLPLGLDRAVSKALAKSPGERYQHVEDLAVDLQALRRRSSGRSLATSRVPISRRAVTRLVAGTIGVAGASAWLIWRFGHTQDPPTETVPFRSGDPLSLNPEANEYYRMAMSVIDTDAGRGVQLLKHALALDPKFATARAEYAFFTFLKFLDGYSDDSAVLYEAEENLHQAARDDPGNSRAYAVLGAIYLSQGRKEEAARELEAAHKLNPEHLDTLNWRSNYHWMNGNSDEALRIANKMVEKAPAFFPARMHVANIQREGGNWNAALQQADKVLAQYPQQLYGLLPKTRILIDAGDLLAARQTFELISPKDREVLQVQLMKALLLAVEGNAQAAREAMNERVVKFAASRIFWTSDLAEFHAVLGDTSTALDWLERAVRSGDERAEWFERDPLLASLRPTEKFKSIQNLIAFRRQRRGLGKQ